MHIAPKVKKILPTDSEDSTLSMYFKDIAQHALMTAEEEVACAKHVETCEAREWCAVLSYGPAVERVLTALGKLEGSPELDLEFRVTRKLRDEESGVAWDSKMETIGKRIRSLDVNRKFIAKAKKEARRAGASEPSKASAAYLKRVAEAESASRRAKEKFVQTNLRLVASLAKRYGRGNMALADLIQEGNIGLMKAVERFDHTRGYRFSTYASWWIRHTVSRALADKSREIRIPVHMLDAYTKVLRATQNLVSRFGIEPSLEEIAKEAGLPVDKVEKMQEFHPTAPISLDKPMYAGGGSDGGNGEKSKLLDHLEEKDAPGPDESLLATQWQGHVKDMLLNLTPIESRIVRWRYGMDSEELTLREVGEKYNLSRERIRQLQDQALRKLKRQMELKGLEL